MANEALRTPESSKAVTIRTYLTEEQLRGVVEAKADKIHTAVLALHDKDTHKDGTPKEPHIHLNLLLDRSRQLKNIKAWFKATDEEGRAVQSYVESVLDTEAMDDYLTHNTAEARAEGKYQYEDCIIKVLKGEREDFRAFKTDWMRKRDASLTKELKADETDQMIRDIEAGLSFREMAHKYGRDYMKNVWTYRDYVAHLVIEETGDFDRACALQGRHMRDELDRQCMKEYHRGTHDGVRMIQMVIRKEIENGATYLKDTEKVLETFMKEIERVM